MSTDDLAEDQLISSVLAVTLRPTDDNGLHFLASLAAELESESGTQALLRRDIVDRVLVARLIDEPPPISVFSPFQYLLRCYANVYQQARGLPSKYRNAQLLQRLNATVVEIKDLILSYAALVFTPGVIPAKEQPTGLQLLASLEAIAEPKVGIEPMPALFLEEFANRQDVDLLQDLLRPICHKLGTAMLKTSLAGEYSRPLQILKSLLDVPKLASVITHLLSFLSPHEDGYKFEMGTFLGAFLSVSALPDRGNTMRPNIGQEFFANHENLGVRDLHQSIVSLRRASNQFCDDLHSLFRTLLKKDTRSQTIQWLVHAIESNNARSQMRPAQSTISSNGFCLNLCNLLLKLCEPFMDPHNGKAWPHVTHDYVLSNDRLNFKDETRLAMASSDAEEMQKKALEQQSEKPTYHFICECFFMTLKALHLGTVKLISGLSNLMRQIHNIRTDTEELEAAFQAEQNPIRRTQAELELKRYKAILDHVEKERLCMEAVLCDESLLTQLNLFYQLVLVWMTRLTNVHMSDSFQVPLPDPVPPSFAALPEYFLEDLVDVLIHTGHEAPQVFQSVRLQETVIFFMAMMGSPHYVTNPYLRTKLTEVLHVCLPESLKHHPNMRRRSDLLAFVFEDHPVILRHLVPCLLQLYVDIEFTGRHSQFYEKFQMRTYISEILEYVWNIKEHNQAWKAVAEQDGGRGLYLQFCHLLVTDSIFLLDESLKKLEEIRGIETLMAHPEEWNALTADERQQQERDLRQYGAHLRSSFHQAKGYINYLRRVTRETQKTFLLPEMVERVASMLNYFLKYITGPERKKLKIKNPEEYDFDPKKLLTGILEIYLHLESADGERTFASAVSSDGRSYRDEMFNEALVVVEKHALMELDKVQLIRRFAQECKDAALHGAREEEILGEVPDEFLDPIQCTLMRDPVTLPTSGQILDRTTITRHLLSDPKDPFNREPLTVEMLEPNDDLRSRIEGWLKEQRSSTTK